MEIQHIVSSVIGQGPTLIAYLLAVIFGIVHMGKHKKAAMLVMLGGITAGVVSLLAAIARPILLEKAYSGDSEAELSHNIVTGTNCCSGVFEAVGIGLIVFGAFAGRQAAEEPDDRNRRTRSQRADDRPPVARPAKRVEDRKDLPPAAPPAEG